MRRERISCFGIYTWTFGSQVVREESEFLWERFGKELAEIKAMADKQGSDFFIWISPLLYDIDPNLEKHTNAMKRDFSCATIRPRERLAKIAENFDIGIIDPLSYLKAGYEQRMKEGNFEYFYFPGDDNHFTPVAGNYLAEYLYSQLKERLDDDN